MEKIDHKDLDFFLLRVQTACAKKTEWEKKEAEWRSLYGFKIWIPERFSLADQELAEEVFWSENRPETLFSTDDRTAGITIQIIETEIKSVEEVKRQLNNLDHRIVWYDTGETEGKVKVHWLEYKNFACDERVYNLLFFFRIGSRNILGTFYCLFEKYDTWKPMVWEMMQSIEENVDERV